MKEAEAALTLPLQLTLADVARLAKVQRPVVSVWRSRSAGSAVPFPPPFATVRGEERFDAEAIVDWLELTERGNNPDARADLAAFAWPRGMSEKDDEISFNGLASLLCLKEVSGQRLGELCDDDLLDLCDEVDPDDDFLMREVDLLGERRAQLCAYADALADASYTCAAAFEQLIRERSRLAPAGLINVALHESAQDLVASLATALALGAGLEPAVYFDPTRGGSDLLVSLVRRGDEVGDATVATVRHSDGASRHARRRLRVHGVRCQLIDVVEDGSWAVPTPAVLLAQYPGPGRPTMTDEEILTEVDNFAVQMDDAHRAVVIAPAGVLSDRIRDRSAEGIRDGLLRLGRVRGIIRLPKGLVTNKPRQALALWALGPAHDGVAVQDRWTMVADLTDSESARRRSVTS